MDFGRAIEYMEDGNSVGRVIWEGGIKLKLVPAGEVIYGSSCSEDCIVSVGNDFVIRMGWVPSQQDMLAKDWFIYK